jgi:NAD-dependent dihydropyrimidine dehydrogenase PreA subunit
MDPIHLLWKLLQPSLIYLENTSIKISFKRNKNINKLLKAGKNNTGLDYNLSGIHELTCVDCNKC